MLRNDLRQVVMKSRFTSIIIATIAVIFVSPYLQEAGKSVFVLSNLKIDCPQMKHGYIDRYYQLRGMDTI